MALLAWFLALTYVGSQIWLLMLLYRAKARAQRKLTAKKTLLSGYPDISILTSLKGPTPGAEESVRSLLTQSYPGHIELVISVKDESEMLVAPIQRLVSELGAEGRVRWVFPVDTTAMNPRTIKIARAAQESKSPWLFVTCVDTRFSPTFLRECAEIAAGNKGVYVTSFPVIDQGRSFAARLEAIGLNVDVSQFFLISSLDERPECAYGGALFFSRELLERAGGYDPLVKLLTDDVTLAQAFNRVGGRGRLSSEYAYVRQEKHSFKEFWRRQVRWRMIGKYFLPKMFWLGPLSWNLLYVIAIGLSGHLEMLAPAVGVILIARVFAGWQTQKLLLAPPEDRWSAFVLPIYDLIAVVAWVAAAFKKTVAWGPTLMRVDQNGAVVATTPA